MNYMRRASEKARTEIKRMVMFMSENRTNKWEEPLPTGMIIPIYKKKGSATDKNNYRRVCLLVIASRLIARFIANRFRLWAEYIRACR